MLEIPVTTVPVVKVPMHVSYLMYLGQFSAKLAVEYFRTALALCRAAGIEPSLLLHPLDLLGLEDAPELAFFPAMHMPAQKKLALVRGARHVSRTATAWCRLRNMPGRPQSD